jgi:hypothetical protein
LTRDLEIETSSVNEVHIYSNHVHFRELFSNAMKT